MLSNTSLDAVAAAWVGRTLKPQAIEKQPVTRVLTPKRGYAFGNSQMFPTAAPAKSEITDYPVRNEMSTRRTEPRPILSPQKLTHCFLPFTLH